MCENENVNASKSDSQNKSMRNCEIVSHIYKADGTGCYWTTESIEKVLKEKEYLIEKYSYIIHDKDTYTDEDEEKNPSHKKGTLKPPHIHLLVAFKKEQPQHLANIAAWFSLPPNMISDIKRSWKRALLYQTHLNAPDKHQYSPDEVTASFNYKEATEKIEKEEVRKEEMEVVTELLRQILDGTIREYNKTILIDNLLLVKHASKFKEAFKVRSEHLQTTAKERQTECIFITGCSGCGKTTLAKQIAKSKGLDYFVSSASNDILDGYRQEPVLILDDIRPSALGLSDLLKLLDNNTASSVKSRYYNKYVHANLIILTSILDIETFYKHVFTESKEPITQLKRRCGTYIKMDMRNIKVSIWDNKTSTYTTDVVYTNNLIQAYISEEPKTVADADNRAKALMPFLFENTHENVVNCETLKNNRNEVKEYE